MESVLLDVAGHRRSPATMPGYHAGRPPRNKGAQYPADPPTVEEVVSVMRIVGDRADGHRLRALIALLWRAGLRISEALALQESELDRSHGAVLVRHGKGGKRREVGMDRWAWEQLDPWLEIRRELPIGALPCVIHGPTAGRRWEASAARSARCTDGHRRRSQHALASASGDKAKRRRVGRVPGRPAYTPGWRQARRSERAGREPAFVLARVCADHAAWLLSGSGSVKARARRRRDCPLLKGEVTHAPPLRSDL